MTEYIKIAENCVLKIEYKGENTGAPMSTLSVIRDGEEKTPRKQVRTFIYALVEARKKKRNGHLRRDEALARIWAGDFFRDDVSDSFKKVVQETRGYLGREALASDRGRAFWLVNEIVVSGGDDADSVPDALGAGRTDELPPGMIYDHPFDWESRKIHVLSAPPGYGKTVLSLQHAKALKERGFFRKVILIDCLSVAGIYRSLGLSVIGGGEDYSPSQALERLMESVDAEARIQETAGQRMLLIFDNYRCAGEGPDAAGDLAENAVRASAAIANVYVLVNTWLSPALLGFSGEEADFFCPQGIDASAPSSLRAALAVLRPSEDLYPFSEEEAREILELAGSSRVSPAELSAVRISVNINYAADPDSGLGWRDYYRPGASSFEDDIYSLDQAVRTVLSCQSDGGGLFADMLRLSAVMGLDSFEPAFMHLCLKQMKRYRDLEESSAELVLERFRRRTGVFARLDGERVRLLHCYRQPVLRCMGEDELSEAFSAVTSALRELLDRGLYYSAGELKKVSELAKYADGLLSAVPARASEICDILCRAAWYFTFVEREPVSAGVYYDVIESAVPYDSDTVFYKALALCDRMYLRLKTGGITPAQASSVFFAVSSAASGLEDYRQMLLARLYLVCMEYLLPRLGGESRLGGMSLADFSEAAADFYPRGCEQAAARLGTTPALRGEYAFLMEHAAALAVLRARAASLESIGGSKEKVISVCSVFLDTGGEGLSPRYLAESERLGSLASLFGQKPFDPKSEQLLFARLRNSLGVAYFEGDDSSADLLRSLSCLKEALGAFEPGSFECCNCEMNVQTVFRLLGQALCREGGFDPSLEGSLDELISFFADYAAKRYGLDAAGPGRAEGAKKKAARCFSVSYSLLAGLEESSRGWKREKRSGFSDLAADIDQNSALLALAAVRSFKGGGSERAAAAMLEKGRAAIGRALKDARAKGQDLRVRTFLRYAAQLSLEAERYDEALSLIDSALAMTSPEETGPLCLALEVKGEALLRSGSGEEEKRAFADSIPDELLCRAPAGMRDRLMSTARRLADGGAPEKEQAMRR